MMTLPNFTNPEPDIQSLWNEQHRLVKQADKMIEQTGIMAIFSKYGELSKIGGSYEYGLMVYPDIDVGLVANEINKDIFAGLVHELALNGYVRKISTADGVNFVPVLRAGRPKGYWVGLEIPFENDRWGIDCWLQQPDWMTGASDRYLEPLKSLDQSGKDAILLIKYDLIRRGLYGKTVFSGDVYDAVLDKNVRTAEEFNQLR